MSNVSSIKFCFIVAGMVLEKGYSSSVVLPQCPELYGSQGLLSAQLDYLLRGLSLHAIPICPLVPFI